MLLYDLRSNTPTVVKDHNYGLPIRKIVQHATTRNVLSADAKAVRIWDQTSVRSFLNDRMRPGYFRESSSLPLTMCVVVCGEQGQSFTTVEPTASVNDLCLVEDSGVFFVANESERMFTYFIPVRRRHSPVPTLALLHCASVHDVLREDLPVSGLWREPDPTGSN